MVYSKLYFSLRKWQHQQRTKEGRKERRNSAISFLTEEHLDCELSLNYANLITLPGNLDNSLLEKGLTAVT